MADTSFSTGDALTQKLWSRKLFREVLKQTDVGKFFGTDSNSLIHIQEDLKKNSGDRITLGLRMQLSQAGIAGDGTLEGNEEELIRYSDNIFVDQLRHAVRITGRMTEQRVTYNLRDEGRMGLQDWWTDRIATAFFNQVCSNVNATDTRYTGMQAATTADASHNWVSGLNVFTSAANLMVAMASASVSNRFSLTIVDNLVAQAKTLTPMIRPVSVPKVGNVHVMFIHPFQTKDLRITTGTGTWQDIQKAALMGGQISNNPIFTGALGMYNNVVLHEDSRIPLSCDNGGTAVAGTRAAVFCGAQAAGFAIGQGYEMSGGSARMSWEEELFDYGNRYGVAAGMIWGMKKMVFNSLDFGTIRVNTSVSV